MKILITGGSGFIARSLYEAYLKECNVTSCNSKQLNLLDAETVLTFLKSNNFDVVIHTATYDAAPKFSTKDPNRVFEFNTRMFFNIVRCEDYFGKMIYFGSGAEFSRNHWKPRMSEEYFDVNMPEDQYGLSKYIMTKYALKSDRIINLRLFGLYGKYDDWRYRLIPNLCCRAIFDLPLEMTQNRIYDFMYIDDLINIVKLMFQTNPVRKVYNICSGNTYDFKTIAQKILDISGKELEISFKTNEEGQEYSGDNSLFLQEFKDFKFTNIETGISELYQWYKENTNIMDPKELN